MNPKIKNESAQAVGLGRIRMYSSPSCIRGDSGQGRRGVDDPPQSGHQG